MAVVCEKIDLKPGETMLDIGCGWGTLAKFASVNYGAKVTGVTLARNQTVWGNDGLRKAGIQEEQSRILCCDYRDVPKKKYNKGKKSDALVPPDADANDDNDIVLAKEDSAEAPAAGKDDDTIDPEPNYVLSSSLLGD